MSNKSGIGDNVISLPQGGGAQQGMGETFSPDLFTGTGNFSVPIAVPAGRNGFQPQLGLGYSTGNGNSAFGMGWGISVPGIMRKTNRGIPIYDDEQDTFVLSGAEDLVLIDKQSETIDGIAHHQWKYRPRTEGLFARIVHHKFTDGRDYWEVKSKDGLTSFYGDSEGQDIQFQLSNPTVADNIFAWKLSKTVDVFGNSIVYHYNRVVTENKEHTAVQLYLSQIQYMNYDDAGTDKFLCSVKFNYEDRPDAFSEGRAGFEVRTTLRCTSMESFTHPKAADLPSGYTHNPEGNNVLVKRYDLRYQDELGALPLNGASVLTEIQVSGYNAATDETESMPPINFGYTEFEPDSRDFFPLEGKALPAQSLAAPELELADLDGNGLPDFIEMNRRSVRVWKNLGNGKFALPQLMKNAPAFSLADPEVQLMDADGDGRIDLVVSKPGVNGYFPLNHEGSWDSNGMKRYKTAPSFSFADPEVKMLDLNGNGITDVLRSSSRFENFYQKSFANGTLKAEGWSGANTSNRGQLDIFPNVNFSNPHVKLADMNGDGLQDIVKVENGAIWYWPNLGHGKWGKRRTMKKAGVVTLSGVEVDKAFLFPSGWDPSRVILGDVVGNGTADLIYLENGKISLWINQSGNQWSEKITIKGTPAVYDADAVRLVDLLGTGVAGLLFTYNNGEGGLANQSSYFLDFTKGVKPYVMNTMNNNMGAITKVSYESSVHAWMRDNTNDFVTLSGVEVRQNRPWKTTLPFPVQVVAKTEVIDEISKGKLVTNYHYSHGYWDGYEREFRGFGRVEQTDTENFERFNKNTTNVHNTVDLIHYSPPTKSINWFHLGGINNADSSNRDRFYEADFSTEYWQTDPNVLERSQATNTLLESLEPHDRRDAYRAWRGSKLRTELYAADADGNFTSALAQKPFTVSEASFGVRLEQASGTFVTQNGADASTFVTLSGVEVRQKAILFSFSEASRSTNWERGDEPKTSFSFTADFDGYGQAKKQVSIAVPRGKNPLTGRAINGAVNIHSGGYPCTSSESTFIYKDEAGAYICDRSSEQKSFEIVNDGTDSVFDLRDKVIADTATKKVLGHSLVYYDGGAYTGLALGNIGSYGVVTRTESLYSTLADLDAAYPERPEIFATTPDLATYPSEFDDSWNNDRAGYEFKTGDPNYETGFYVTSGLQQYDFQTGSGYGLVTAMKDVFDQVATVEFDSYSFLPKKVINPLGMETSSEYDYRILQASKVTDANDNESAFVFSPLGLLKATAVMGKAGANEGDTLAVPGTVMEYDFNAFYASKQPIWVKTIQREFHVTDPTGNDNTFTSIEYSDGFGRLLQSRSQAEDVLYTQSGLPGDQAEQNANAVGSIKGENDPDNVVVNGFKIYNNKGKVVEQFEPYFDSGYGYALTQQIAQKIRLFYDVLGRPTQTLNPDGTAQLSVYGTPDILTSPTLQSNGRFTVNYKATPWESYAYDANDLGGDTHPVESSAYSTHWNTPESSEIDTLGRTIKTVQRMETGNTIEMKYQYDIQGRLTQVTDPENRINFEYSYATVAIPKGEEATPPEAEALKIWHLDSGTIRQAFDARGQIIERTDEKQNRAWVAYESRGLKKRVWLAAPENAARITEFYRYGHTGQKSSNSVGNPTQFVDESGFYYHTQYDFKGNLLHKQYQVIKDDLLTNSTAFKINWFGVNMPNTATSDAQIFETSVTFDALNRTTQVTLPEDVTGNRKVIVPTYNRAGALESVNYDGDEMVKELAYNAKGQRVLVAFGNGVMNRYSYDPTNFRLLRMKAEKYSFSETAGERTYTYLPGTCRQDLGYEYDLNGNILKKKNRTPDAGISGTTLGIDALDNEYAYDAISRLLNATGRESDQNGESHRWADAPVAGSPNASNTQAYARSYVYDKVGNIKKLQQTGSNAFTRDFNYSTNTLDDIEVSGTKSTFVYDANGNLTQSGTSKFYEWNEKDQLVFFKIQSGGTPSLYAHYLYNAGGERVKKIVWDQQGNKDVTVYIDGVFEYRLKQEDGVDKTQNIIHIMDDATRIAEVRIGTAFNDDMGHDVTYTLDDHLGSANTRLDDNGSIIDHQEYYPFGDTSLRTYNKKRYQYVGKEKDQESGLIYYGARYYAAWTCRFISVDPLADKFPFLTPYQNASNEVINFVDIEGLQKDGATPKPEGGNAEGTAVRDVEGNATSWTFEVHQAPPPEPMQMMQPKGLANDATSVAPAQTKTPLTPRQDFLERSANLTKQGMNSNSKGTLDLPWNDMRSQSFQKFKNTNYSMRLDQAGVDGVDIGETITGVYAIKTIVKNWKSISSLVKKSDDIKSIGAAAKNFNKGKKIADAISKKLNPKQLDNLVSTETYAQSDNYVKAMQETILTDDTWEMMRLMTENVYTTTYKGTTYILNGHNRVKAYLGLGKSLDVTELSHTKAHSMFASKMQEIYKGLFD